MRKRKRHTAKISWPPGFGDAIFIIAQTKWIVLFVLTKQF